MHPAAKHLKSMVYLSISASFVKRFRLQGALPASGARVRPLKSALHLTTNQLATRRNPGRAQGGSDTSNVGPEAGVAGDVVNVSILNAPRPVQSRSDLTLPRQQVWLRSLSPQAPMLSKGAGPVKATLRLCYAHPYGRR
jgi:hypothetical protein